jgi:cell wall-associated NlpC family hydrolase
MSLLVLLAFGSFFAASSASLIKRVGAEACQRLTALQFESFVCIVRAAFLGAMFVCGKPQDLLIVRKVFIREPVEGHYLFSQTLRKHALPALMGVALTVSVMAPNVAFAENQDQADVNQTTVIEQTSPLASGVHSIISDSLLENASALVQQESASNLVDMAMSFQGTPYVYGGTTPAGFDCSGFTQYCFRNALGIDLPRTAAAQAGMGEQVSLDNLQEGDLLFWGSGSGVYHVAIYVGNNSYIHAAGTGKGVRVQNMDYFYPSFAKRITV